MGKNGGWGKLHVKINHQAQKSYNFTPCKIMICQKGLKLLNSVRVLRGYKRCYYNEHANSMYTIKISWNQDRRTWYFFY